MILFPVAGLAVAFAVFLIIDGIRNWARKREIAKLCELRRQISNTISPALELHPPSITPPIQFFEITCEHCDGVLIIPETLRDTQIACPRCKETVYTNEAKPVLVASAIRPGVLANSR